MIILALIIFNAMLITTSMFFPATTYEQGAEDVVNVSTYEPYRNLDAGSILGAVFSTEATAAIGVIFAFSVVATLLSRNLAPVGIGVGVALFTGLYIGLIKVVTGISSNPFILTVITIVGICIGVIIAFDIAESLKGRQDV